MAIWSDIIGGRTRVDGRTRNTSRAPKRPPFGALRSPLRGWAYTVPGAGSLLTVRSQIPRGVRWWTKQIWQDTGKDFEREIWTQSILLLFPGFWICHEAPKNSWLFNRISSNQNILMIRILFFISWYSLYFGKNKRTSISKEACTRSEFEVPLKLNLGWKCKFHRRLFLRKKREFRAKS